MLNRSIVYLGREKLLTDYHSLAKTSYYNKMCMLGQTGNMQIDSIKSLDKIYSNSEEVIIMNYLLGMKGKGDKVVKLYGCSLKDKDWFSISPDRLVRTTCTLNGNHTHTIPFDLNNYTLDVDYGDAYLMQDYKIQGETLRIGSSFKQNALKEIMVMCISHIINPELLMDFSFFVTQVQKTENLIIKAVSTPEMAYNTLAVNMHAVLVDFDTLSATIRFRSNSVWKWYLAYEFYIVEANLPIDIHQDTFNNVTKQLIIQSNGKIIPIKFNIHRSLQYEKYSMTNKFILKVDNDQDATELLRFMRQTGCIVEKVNRAIKLYKDEQAQLLSFIGATLAQGSRC